MDLVQVMCPDPLVPLLSLSHSCSLLLLPRVGVEEPFEEDQNENHWQYFRWHKGILRNKLTGPGFPSLSNLFLTDVFLYAICLLLSSCVCQPSAPFSKGARGQVKSNDFSTLSLGWLMYLFLRLCLLTPRFEQCCWVSPCTTGLSVESNTFAEPPILSPQNSAYSLVNKDSNLERELEFYISAMAGIWLTPS